MEWFHDLYNVPEPELKRIANAKTATDNPKRVAAGIWLALLDRQWDAVGRQPRFLATFDVAMSRVLGKPAQAIEIHQTHTVHRVETWQQFGSILAGNLVLCEHVRDKCNEILAGQQQPVSTIEAVPATGEGGGPQLGSAARDGGPDVASGSRQSGS